jgi:cell division GTPase FtsZ
MPVMQIHLINDDIMNTSEESYLIIGTGGLGVRAVDEIQSRYPSLCRYAVCDTDDRTLACSGISNKHLLTESSLLWGIVRGADTVILTAVLGGATGDRYAHAICSKAKECGAKVFAMVATSPRPEDTERAQAALSELRKALGSSLWVIDSLKLSQSYSPQPSPSRLLHLLLSDLSENTRLMAEDRIRTDSALKSILRHVNVLMEDDE